MRNSAVTLYAHNPDRQRTQESVHVSPYALMQECNASTLLLQPSLGWLVQPCCVQTCCVPHTHVEWIHHVPRVLKAYRDSLRDRYDSEKRRKFIC